MVEIKRKVSLRVKTEQNSEPTPEKKQPTLRKKEPIKEPIPQTPINQEPPTEPSESNGKKGYWKYILGTVIAVGLCYGAYYAFNSSSKTDEASKPLTEVVKDNDSNNVQATDSTKESAAEDKPAVGEENSNGASATSPKNEENAGISKKSQAETKQASNVKPATEKRATAHSNAASSEPSEASQQVSVLSGTLEQKANEVIRGNYGNGEVRKQKLGEQYTEIQSKVNEMYRNGLVK